MDEFSAVESIFIAALGKGSPEERDGYLGDACGPDRELRDRIVRLLNAHQGAGAFLEGSDPVGVATVDVPSGEERPGTVIGPYKLLQVIGEGGMGTVYLAEQTEPVRRLVALKLIKPGMDSRQFLARFGAERQALALMDHPHIAKVLDAGATDAGRPYFVMELVKGIPITQFCDERRLSTRQRLELAVPVCQAVQHAHQKGVIHRDLKPSNVLVALYDDKPVPKVIDFGVAKAAGPRLTDQTLFTEFGTVVGTLEYMSPEQAQLNQLDIDTRSDIYSLGVLLYELLTGSTPLERKRLQGAAFLEMLRVIREEEPPRPSTRLSTTEELPSIAACRDIEPRKLSGLLRRELDWIVMKALEKDRNRRYETASGLAADLRRYLDGEAVLACPPSARYRFAKLARRNRVALVTSVVVGIMLLVTLAALAIGTVLIAQERNAADRERVRAEANFRKAREAVDRVFTRAAEGMADRPHMERIRRDLLEDALEFYQGFLRQKGDDPSVRHETALAYFRVGKIDSLLGRYDRVLPSLEQARAMLEELARREPGVPAYRTELADTHHLMGYSTMWARRLTESIEHRRRDLALREGLHRQFPTVPEYLRQEVYARAVYAEALRDAGRPAEAIEHFRHALAQYEKESAAFPRVPQDRELLAYIHHWLGRALMGTGRIEEAERSFRRSRALREQLVAMQPENASFRHKLTHISTHLAILLTGIGRLAEAEALLRQVVAIDEKLLDEFPDNADYRRRAGSDFEAYGRTLAARQRPKEAEAVLRRSVTIRNRTATDYPGVPVHLTELAWSHYELGVLLETLGRSAEAADASRRAIGIFEKLTAQHPEVPEYQNDLAWILTACPAVQSRDPDRALMLSQRAVQRQPRRAQNWGMLGIAQYRAGDPAAAIDSLRKAMAFPDGADPTYWIFLAMAYWRRGDHSQARAWYDKAEAWIEKNHPAAEEYGRFRAEAAALMGRTDPAPCRGQAPDLRERPAPP